eukprot:scaffold302065_cov20-Prasinocladus_malaysianus.AAC.1
MVVVVILLDTSSVESRDASEAPANISNGMATRCKYSHSYSFFFHRHHLPYVRCRSEAEAHNS